MELPSKILRLIASIILIALFGGCIQDTPPEGRSLIADGDRLPQFSVTMADGATVTTDDLAGAPSMIVLFTTTCPDCRELLPVLEELHHRHPGLRMLLIARSQDAATLAAYWEANALTLPYSPQPDAAVYHLFATATVPRVYLADATLTVRAQWDDAPVPTLTALETALAPSSPPEKTKCDRPTTDWGRTPLRTALHPALSIRHSAHRSFQFRHAAPSGAPDGKNYPPEALLFIGFAAGIHISDVSAKFSSKKSCNQDFICNFAAQK